MSKWILFGLLWAVAGSVLLFPFFANNGACPFTTTVSCHPVTNFVDIPPLPIIFFPTYSVLHIAVGEFAFNVTSGVHSYQGLAVFLPLLWIVYAFFTYAIYKVHHDWNRDSWMRILGKIIGYGLLLGVIFIFLKWFVMRG